MAKFKAGDTVYAPVFRITNDTDGIHAVKKGTVKSVSGRSCTVDLGGSYGVKSLASALLHSNVAVCIVRIGDLQSELSLLDPICKSILNFLRLVLPDDQVTLMELRSRGEFEHLFRVNGRAYRHWIIVGHGTSAGELSFFHNIKVPADELAGTIQPHLTEPGNFIFLSCHTGKSAFGKRFSQNRRVCGSLIAPTGTLHGAVASQFAQTLLSFHFMEGRTIAVAFNKAAQHIPTATNFRLWQSGELK